MNQVQTLYTLYTFILLQKVWQKGANPSGRHIFTILSRSAFRKSVQNPLQSWKHKCRGFCAKSERVFLKLCSGFCALFL